MAALNKTAIEEANKQLNGMYQQMVEQERQFKTELHEKEQEIVRLHTLLREMEERLVARAETAEAEAARMGALADEKDREAFALEEKINEIATVVNRPLGDGHGAAATLASAAGNRLITPAKLVKLPSNE
mmetsp:Transcript_20924/g.54398  ORF Transcript_20924/g.54398 Transcript_20924/m.54398 type:complete len:130 (-) Transcript_20924:274-663(-)|eukprot:CAMPEP_0182926810 /NCGR_PEP_ID=MMETSP0105_2-20130417/12288_1 /TAXON_ID=81532 ORGANISM="Acanthoeca-like sp., Strain 10tr" /NCGR_SAMPLE_ID=MMETSP0105_2 /ASSEMBLY_ACC=CAM_ASM_000205 /LENGTH=129 /DNA_ID=CAMNT_0025064719 /DNA_START=235 /DNA_END=624 /DNA_ORIENTATION=+